jgi:hypothetical protein
VGSAQDNQLSKPADVSNLQDMVKAIDDKAVVKDYFNATGFDRWRRICEDGLKC